MDASRAIPRLHVITDVNLQRRFGHVELARQAIAGGADLVQLRDKQATDAELEPLARAMLAVCGSRVLLIDDRVDLVVRVGAGGLHVGVDDVDPWTARRLVGPEVLIGATVNDLGRLEALRGAPIDYIGVGPIFGTAHKVRPSPTLGLAGLAEICRASPWPVIGIGSITWENAAAVRAAGASGVAVLGDVALADDPEAATRRLARAVGLA